MTMLGTWRIAFGTPLCLLLLACSPPSESKKAAAPAAPAAAKEEPVPEVFQVNLDTSKGQVVIEVRREWAPRGADHFYSLVKTGFYDGNRFFRVVRNFVVQFGINGDPQLNRLWDNANLPDDPVKQSNIKGTLTYAKLGPNSRSTQLFINLKDNKTLDKQGFAPIGRVISGMDTVERFYGSYGEVAPAGRGPDPTQIELQGNDYLADNFSRLDYIKKATVQ